MPAPTSDGAAFFRDELSYRDMLRRKALKENGSEGYRTSSYGSASRSCGLDRCEPQHIPAVHEPMRGPACESSQLLPPSKIFAVFLILRDYEELRWHATGETLLQDQKWITGHALVMARCISSVSWYQDRINILACHLERTAHDNCSDASGGCELRLRLGL